MVARTIMNCCSLWMILGGVSDHDTLERISKLLGSVAVTDPEGEVKHLAILPPEMIRQLPKWRALMVRSNSRRSSYESSEHGAAAMSERLRHCHRRGQYSPCGSKVHAMASRPRCRQCPCPFSSRMIL